jgi:hypothetical protein
LLQKLGGYYLFQPIRQPLLSFFHAMEIRNTEKRDFHSKAVYGFGGGASFTFEGFDWA